LGPIAADGDRFRAVLFPTEIPVSVVGRCSGDWDG
jgi:hypothetical protein